MTKTNNNKEVNMSMIPEETLNADKRMPVTILFDPEEVSIQRKQKRATKPNYFMIGNGTMNKHRMYAIDLLEEVAKSTKAEQFLLLSIKDGICYGNDYNPVVNVIGETKYQQNMITEGYKSLAARGLVLRVKKAHYMINPNALIPPDYEGALQVWEATVRKHELKNRLSQDSEKQDIQ